jgi:hypothetical protein
VTITPGPDAQGVGPVSVTAASCTRLKTPAEGSGRCPGPGRSEFLLSLIIGQYHSPKDPRENSCGTRCFGWTMKRPEWGRGVVMAARVAMVAGRDVYGNTDHPRNRLGHHHIEDPQRGVQPTRANAEYVAKLTSSDGPPAPKRSGR